MGRNIWFVWNLDDVADGTIDAFAGEDVDCRLQLLSEVQGVVVGPLHLLPTL